MVHLSAFFERRFDHERWIFTELLEVPFGDDNYILGYPESRKGAESFPSCIPPVGPIRHDNQQIHIARRTHLTAGSGAEKDHPERMNGPGNTPYDFFNKFRI
jgi:hypothetical protein